MTTARLMIVVLALATATSLDAQGPVVLRKSPVRESEWTVLRVAKWALLGGAIGFGAYALDHSRTAERAYALLRDRCSANNESCQIVDGRYSDPASEALYLQSTRSDRRAQVGIYGGQVAILGSVGLFIFDLRNGRGPEDIPYPARRTVTVGARLTF